MVKCGYCKNKIEPLDYANGTKFRCCSCSAEFFSIFKIGDMVLTIKGDNMRKDKIPYGGKVIGFGMWRQYLGVIVENKSWAKEKSMFLNKNLRFDNAKRF